MNYYKSAQRKIRTALTLSHGDWGIFIKAWFWLLVIDLLLRTLPYPRVLQCVENRRPDRLATGASQAWEVIRRNRRFVLLAARYHFYRITCLRQALALKGLLGVRGIATKLRFGVRKEAGQLLAHAWLDYEGQSIELAHHGKEQFEPLATLAESQ